MSKKTRKQSQAATELAKNPNSILDELFSLEFMNNLKNELNVKVRSSKTVGNDDEPQTMTKKYEQIHELQLKVRKISVQNQQLKKTLHLMNSNVNTSVQQTGALQNNYLKKTQRLKIMPIEDLNVKVQSQFDNDLEKQTLRQKLRNLQEYKAMKQKRFSEMIAKTAFYVEQINLLRYKNQELSNTIRIMRTTMLSPQNLSSLNVKGEQNFKKQYNSVWNQVSPCQNVKNNPENSGKAEVRDSRPFGVESEILVSNTVDLVIPPEYDLCRMCLQKSRLVSPLQFNEIDYIIGEELPYLATSRQSVQKCCQANLNNSVVAIEL